MIEKPIVSAFGAVGAAFASALCCAGPLLYVGFGIGGAGLANTFEPLRPWFLALTALLLGFGFYSVYGPEPRCAENQNFEQKRRRQELTLWAGAILVFLFATFPTWSTWIL